MGNHTLSSFHANDTSMKNKMMGKAFSLLPKTNLSLPGKPKISGSNKSHLIGWNFYTKTNAIWTNRQVQFCVSPGCAVLPTKLGPSFPALARQNVFQPVRLIFLLSLFPPAPVWGMQGQA